MRFTLFIASMFVLSSFGLNAQKFAYVDTDYILRHMPEYSEAQQELNTLSKGWQAEVEAKYESIARLETAYRAEKVLLTPEMRKKREEEIAQKKKDAQELQKLKFGVSGELFQKREELIKPVQDKIYESIKEVSSNSGYMVVFDKSNQSNMLYANPKYDVSDKVIKKMGYKPGEFIEEESDDADSGSKGGAKTDKGNSGGSKGSGGTTRPNTGGRSGGK